MPSAFAVEPLGAHHDRAAFSCSNGSLDDFLKTRARRENELRYCATLILVTAAGSSIIAGYYTLSAHSVTLDGIDATSRKKLPRYPIVPTTLIGRLARDVRFAKTGAREFLLLDALRRAFHNRTEVGSCAVTVDAIDDAASAFYTRYGFQCLADHTNRLYLLMTSIQRLRL